MKEKNIHININIYEVEVNYFKKSIEIIISYPFSSQANIAACSFECKI